MKPEKHVALAKEIVDKIRVELLGGTFKQDHIAVDMIAAALSQVERDALASKVVFPTEREINRAIGDMYDSDIQFLENKCCREQADSYISKGIEWLRSQLTLVPKEQVISPDIDKKEISNDMDNCVCDETHIHNCPVHTHLQDEPEVKAHGFEAIEKEIDKHAGCWAIANKRDSAFEDFKMGAHWFRANAEKYLADKAALSSQAACGEFEKIIQKSVDAIEYDLCDRRGFKHLMSDIREESPEDDYSYQEGYNAAIDDMRKLNGLGDV